MSPSKQERIDDVLSFTSSDASGSFGILANHERMMTVLNAGIANLRFGDGHCEYLGLASAVLHFVQNELRISTTRILRARDYNLLVSDMEREINREEAEVLLRKQTIKQLEESLIKQLTQPLQEGRQ